MSTNITITFAFPNQQLADMAVEHLSAHYGYPATVEVDTGNTISIDSGDKDADDNPIMLIRPIMQNIPNPMDKLEWTKHAIARELRDRIEVRAVAAAKDAVEAQVHAAIMQTVVT